MATVEKDVFQQYCDAEWAFMEHQTVRLRKAFRRIERKAIDTFKAAKHIDGGKEIRVPLSYGD